MNTNRTKKTLAIIITHENGLTTTEYIGDKELLTDHERMCAYELIGRNSKK